MILTISSTTFLSHDSGEVSDCTPLDFVFSVNHDILSFYSLNSKCVKKTEGFKCTYLWNLLKDGMDESHGIDTALLRYVTIVQITTQNRKGWKNQKISFEIILNHYEGFGESNILNILCQFIKSEMALNSIDVDFLNKIEGLKYNQHTT